MSIDVVTPPRSKRLLLSVIIIVLLIAIVCLIAYIALSDNFIQTFTSSDPVSESSTVVQDHISAIEQTIQGKVAGRVSVEELPWFDHQQLGFSFAYPPNWQIKRQAVPTDGLLVFRATAAPQGKRYFREPHMLYPLTVQAYALSFADTQRILQLAGKGEKTDLGAHAAYTFPQSDDSFLTLMEHPYDENITLIFTSDVARITQAGAAEYEELQDSIATILASLQFSRR